MWIKAATSGTRARMELICDQCGATFEGEERHRHDPRSYWHLANIAGWARTARTPDRHLCSNC